MNNEQLANLCKDASKITISLNDYCDLLRENPMNIEILTDKDIMRKGLFGTYKNTKIFVSKDLSDGEYKIVKNGEEE